MKKRIFLTLTCSLIVGIIMAQTPKLVGHRGSIWGVENSAEAFENGAIMGYHGLECDIKVTADSQFVICHDDDLKRFGYPEIKIAETNLSDLQAIVLEQTRREIDYEAGICTLSEYLTICKENDCFPVIELKWATGINENDASLLPRLLSEVDSANLTIAPIFISSMKKCLQQLRSLRPQYSIQLLTYDKAIADNLEWCKTYNMDVDVAKGEFVTAEVIKQFHDAGLKVNVWTLNTESEYTHYANLGVDFITTDSYSKESE